MSGANLFDQRGHVWIFVWVCLLDCSQTLAMEVVWKVYASIERLCIFVGEDTGVDEVPPEHIGHNEHGLVGLFGARHVHVVRANLGLATLGGALVEIALLATVKCVCRRHC